MRNGNTTQMSRLCPPLNNPFWKAYERHTNYSPPAGWNSHAIAMIHITSTTNAICY